MSEKNYKTRQDLVNAIRATNPSMRSQSDQQVYDDFTKRYPEYIRRVDENIGRKVDVDESQEMMPNGEKKTAFTAVANLFSADGYKYLPYIRDAELIESGSMLYKANKLKNGTADAEDLAALKEWVADQNAPQSWGYKTVNLLMTIPAYAVEFATLIGGIKNVGKGIGKGASKAGTKKLIKEVVESKAGSFVTKKVKAVAATQAADLVKTQVERLAKNRVVQLAKNSAEQLATSKVTQFAKGSVKQLAESRAIQLAKEAVEQTGQQKFRETLRAAASAASKRELKLSLKGTLKATGQGMK